MGKKITAPEEITLEKLAEKANRLKTCIESKTKRCDCAEWVIRAVEFAISQRKDGVGNENRKGKVYINVVYKNGLPCDAAHVLECGGEMWGVAYAIVLPNIDDEKYIKFAMCHELGHLLSDHVCDNQEFFYEPLKDDPDKGDTLEGRPQEYFCDAIAFSFLGYEKPDEKKPSFNNESLFRKK